jgi:hypothetical protein
MELMIVLDKFLKKKESKDYIKDLELVLYLYL